MITAALYVIEAVDGQAYLGVPEVDGDWLRVMTDRQGRPVLLHRDDVESITTAERHPDVEW